MDKRTRMMNALNGKQTDRIPVGFWHHYFDDESEGQKCIDAQIKFYREANLDFIKIMSDSFFEYPLPEIKTVSDWYKVTPLDADHPYIAKQIERAKGICGKLKDECMVFYNVFAPFSSIRFGSSDELVMQHLKEDPEAVLHALSSIARTNALLSELLITEGKCDGVYYCLQGGENNRFTVDEYKSLITPSDLYVINHANKFSKYNMLHLCGWAGIKNNLELWKDYPAAAYNWAIFIEEMDLTEGKQFFNQSTVLGGFDNRLEGILFKGTKKELQEYTVDLIKNTDNLGMIIGADCSISDTIDPERIRWIVQASESAASE
jgi:uroporphyrinogen decarboxylase